MKIEITLSVPEGQDIDLTHPMGITAAAHDRLTEAILDAGFEIAEGPDRVIES